MRLSDIEQRLCEVRARLEATTPGSWELCPMGMYVFTKDGSGMAADVIDLEDGPPGSVMRARGHGAGYDRQNGQFIAHAKDDIAFLLDAIAHTMRSHQWAEEIVRLRQDLAAERALREEAETKAQVCEANHAGYISKLHAERDELASRVATLKKIHDDVDRALQSAGMSPFDASPFDAVISDIAAARDARPNITPEDGFALFAAMTDAEDGPQPEWLVRVLEALSNAFDKQWEDALQIAAADASERPQAPPVPAKPKTVPAPFGMGRFEAFSHDFNVTELWPRKIVATSREEAAIKMTEVELRGKQCVEDAFTVFVRFEDETTNDWFSYDVFVEGRIVDGAFQHEITAELTTDD